MGLVVAGTFGCELMTAVDRDKIPEETPGTGGGSGGSAGAKDAGVGGAATGGSAGQGGTGGVAGTGGAAGKGGAGGAAGTGGVAPECETPADCDAPVGECVLATCTAGKCGTENKAKGAAVTAQTAGDCKKQQCDGKGAVEAANDDADLPVDGNACTSDVCTAGVPTNPNAAADTACGTDLKCNANGQCIGCTATSECPGADDECQKRTCSADKVCGLDLTPAGTAVASQTAGDCKQNQCDGKGKIVEVIVTTDAPSDDNECTQDVCLNGVAEHPFKSPGATCSTNNGTVCDGKGACVECTDPVQCEGTVEPCQEKTCIANKCGIGNKAANTVAPSSVQVKGDCKEKRCDGNGAIAATDVNLDTDILDDKKECTVDTCATGTPANTPKAAGTACGTAGGTTKCDANGTCVGCLADAECADTDKCTTGEVCTAGACVPATGTLNCDDNNPCTDDSCDAATGCVHTANTASCSDGNPCTTGDICADKACVPGTTPTDCNDNNVCTTDTCDTTTGCVNAANTAPCQDGDACTTGDTCANKACVPGTGTLTCNDNEVCTTDTCAPATGCVYTNNTDPCTDNNACTTADTCAAGQCVGGAAPNCDDLNPCTDDSCVQATGCVNAANAVACDDGNVCTKTDTCSNKACAGIVDEGANCGSNGKCNSLGVCVGCLLDTDCADGNLTDCIVPKCNTGVCGTQNAAENATCSDNDPCTIGDKCAAGACTVSTPKCAGDVCNDPTCSATGVCGLTPKQGTVPCNFDSNACTQNDVCVSGSCTAGATKDCSASVLDSCHVATCDTTTAACGQAAGNEGTACTFGDQCFSGKTCQSGNCAGGTAVNCADTNPCTDDSCIPATGCLNVIDTNNVCSDNNQCTQTDTCNAQGICVGSNQVVCAAPNQCQELGVCQSATGTCTYASKSGACDDGLFCTTGETCSNGACGGGSTTACSNTTDQCKEAVGTCDEANNVCNFGALPNATPCTNFTHKAAECFDANTVRTFTNVADCQTGVCTEKYTDTVCALGCTNGACKTDLMITEYVEGSGSNKAIEITNFGTAAIDLSQCSLRRYDNGAAAVGATIALTGTLNPGASWVVCNNTAANAQALKDRCQAFSGSITFNGNDPVDLVCGGVVKDSMGETGITAMWAENVTLRRKCTVLTGDTILTDAWTAATEWDSFGLDNFVGLGTSGCTQPNYAHTITIDGTNDFLGGEKFAAGTGYSAYATWDTTHLYIAMEGAAVNSASTAQWWLIYISGTTGTTTGQTYNTQTPGLPFSAGYHVRWKADNAYTHAQTWNGTAWIDAAWDFTGDFAKGATTFVEMRIPLADIGSPTTVSLHMSMIDETAGSETTWAPFPSTSFTGTPYDPDYTKYYEFDLAAGKLPPLSYTPKP